MKVNSVRLAWEAVVPGNFPKDGRPEVCLLGRSNVGKSSLLNKLINREGMARVSKTPGRTQAIHFYMLDERYYLVDLPGFGYAKAPEIVRRNWAALLESYFTHRPTLVLGVQLVDIRIDPTPLDRQLSDFLLDNRIPMVVALTKADKVSGNQIATMTQRAPKVLDLPEGVPVIPTSAHTGIGMAQLSQVVVDAFLAAPPRRRG